MNIVLLLLATYSLAFILKEKDGPFGIINWLRRRLFNLPVVGAFFIQLFECPLCLGFWCSVVLYLLTVQPIKITDLLVCGLAGGTFCLILNAILLRLYRD